MRLGDVHDAGRVAACIAGRIRVDTKQGPELDLQPGFLQRLPPGRILDRFTEIHEPAWQRMAGRRVAALYQDDGPPGPVDQLDDEVDGQGWSDGACHAQGSWPAAGQNPKTRLAVTIWSVFSVPTSTSVLWRTS